MLINLIISILGQALLLGGSSGGAVRGLDNTSKGTRKNGSGLDWARAQQIHECHVKSLEQHLSTHLANLDYFVGNIAQPTEPHQEAHDDNAAAHGK